MLPKKGDNAGDHQSDRPQQIQIKPRFAEQGKPYYLVNDNRHDPRHNEKTEGMYPNSDSNITALSAILAGA